MSESTVWTCDRCGKREMVATGHRPYHWTRVTRSELTSNPGLSHRGPQGNRTADLCRPCSSGIDDFLRNIADSVRRGAA